mgnify:CR=1 FL=1|tara:strand:+ start:18 stop:164 length:147 start_codon:yes stop_codon:yes gene_type:complete
MKLDINETFMAKTAVENATVKGSEAHVVVSLLSKLDIEFNKLEKEINK